MRNLVQYPLTAEEANQALARQVQAIADKQAIGGIDGYALTLIGEFLKRHDAEFRDFLKQSAL
jgi:hypothetical protein